MKSMISTLKCSTATLGRLAFSCLLLFGVSPRTKAQTEKGTGFAIAQEAVDAIVGAAEKFDEKSLDDPWSKQAQPSYHSSPFTNSGRYRPIASRSDAPAMTTAARIAGPRLRT
jgi:hypothetical protein